MTVNVHCINEAPSLLAYVTSQPFLYLYHFDNIHTAAKDKSQSYLENFNK